MKKTLMWRYLIIGGFCLLAVAASGVWLWLQHSKSLRNPPTPSVQGVNGEPAAPTPGARKSLADRRKGNKPSVQQQPAVGTEKKKPQRFIIDEVTLTPQEKIIQSRLQDALDNEDFAAIAALAKDPVFAKNAELRRELIAALSWFGVQSIQELTALLFDENQELAGEAFDAWVSALEELENPATKIQMLEAGLRALVDQDSIDYAMSLYNGLDDVPVVQSLLRIINGDNAEAAAAAREQYRLITGDDYESEKATAQWIADNTEPAEEK